MMDSDKEKAITNFLIKEVFRNEEVLFPKDPEEVIEFLLEVIASLHNEYYLQIWGTYYDYMGHWTNKERGDWIEDGFFKEV